jgi:hypothetical protein
MSARHLAVVAAVVLLAPLEARAFCGFYVGKAGAELYNHASQVILVRDTNRTILSMSNDFKGNLTDFALVVPVPSVITKEQVHIGERKMFDRVDAYSAPRLVEYFDPDPCTPPHPYRMMTAAPTGAKSLGGVSPEREKSLGVTVEASYTLGEYDIVILSAKQSDGLETWLRESGYNVPAQTSRALKPYIKQDMKFFVAKVNLKEQQQGGFTYLRPIQIAYESEKFMLPIRLGMVNADGPQDLIVYTLTRKGRVESSNYKTVPLPSGADIPLYVRDEFASFYKALFETSYRKEDRKAVFTEYTWDTGWCDPCAADPLTPEELRSMGVFWLQEAGSNPPPPGRPGMFRPGLPMGTHPMLTRLHVRYDSTHFPEDLVFQETGDRGNFQARYVLRHAWTGEASCPAAQQYFEAVDNRHSQEVTTLASLTGWSEAEIRKKMGSDAPGKHSKAEPWYKSLWK